MKTTNPESVKFPLLYQKFKSAAEIALTINKSRAYVFKALSRGFTPNEKRLLALAVNVNEKELFEESGEM